MFCQKCGRENPDDGVFCNTCGGVLMKPKPGQRAPCPGQHDDGILNFCWSYNNHSRNWCNRGYDKKYFCPPHAALMLAMKRKKSKGAIIDNVIIDAEWYER